MGLRTASRLTRHLLVLHPDGTDVTVYAPSTLDLPRLKAVADSVVGLTGSRICSCFCAFATQAGRNRADPFGRVECLCADRSTGEQIDNRPQPVPLDVYGERAEGDQSQRFRYPLPAHGGLVVDGLRLSLDAGDRLSWPDAGHTLADVSGGEHSATLHGRVAFEEDGMGCLRFGRNGTQGDHATLELDISPRAMPALTLELWVKLHSLPNPHGWAFGHDTGLARYDRGILMHAAAFEDPSRPGAGSGATAMGVGHPYMSELTPRLHEWTHVVATWGDSGVATLYHNAVGSDADSPADNGEGGNKLVLGGHVRDGGAGVDACIAVARVYDRALAAAEVQANFDFLASRFGK